MRGGKTVWLVGMMGAGKSAVGARLAERLGRRFVDTDTEIVDRSGRSIAAIFAEDGEDAFRSLERSVVESLAGQDAVVGLGGGVIAQRGMARLLDETGTVVYLRARPQTLLARLDGCDERPLLAGLDATARAKRLAELLEERRSAYESARIAIDTDDLSVAKVAARLAQVLGARAPRGSEESTE